MRSILVRLPHLGLLLGLAALLFAMEAGFRPLAGSVFSNLANINAEKTLLGKNDESLPTAAQAYALAKRWFPESARANAMFLATLRATASCQLLHSEDFDDQKVWLVFQGRCLWLAGERDKAVQVWRQAERNRSRRGSLHPGTR
jgi:hypothetical protein